MNRMNEAVAKPLKFVTPAKAGVQKLLKNLDSRLRGNDVCGLNASFATASIAILIEAVAKPPVVISRFWVGRGHDGPLALAQDQLAAGPYPT